MGWEWYRNAAFSCFYSFNETIRGIKLRWNWNAKLLLCGWRSFSDGKSHTLEYYEMGRIYIEVLGSIWTSKLECSVFSHAAVAFSSLRRSELYQNSWKCSLDHRDRGSQCVYWLAFLSAIRQYLLSTFWLKKSTHQNHLSLFSTYFVHVYETFFFFSFARLKQKQSTGNVSFKKMKDPKDRRRDSEETQKKHCKIQAT